MSSYAPSFIEDGETYFFVGVTLRAWDELDLDAENGTWTSAEGVFKVEMLKAVKAFGTATVVLPVGAQGSVRSFLTPRDEAFDKTCRRV